MQAATLLGARAWLLQIRSCGNAVLVIHSCVECSDRIARPRATVLYSPSAASYTIQHESEVAAARG
jgi:hypothetical protein